MEHEQDFFETVKRGDVEALGESLRNSPELIGCIDGVGKTGLHWAAEANQAEAAHLLLDAGADIEAKTSWGATPLDWASTLGSYPVAELLLARGASGYTLIVAAALGKSADVKAMIETGSYTHDDILSEAMYGAARNGHTELVEYLLDRGAAVDIQRVLGGTALHWAAINGHRSTVELLVSRGASLSIRDERFDATPEDWANEGGHTELAQLLHP
jgi:uncharacterized protein